jgi:hypothetical protein
MGAKPINKPAAFENASTTRRRLEPKACHHDPSHSGVEKIDKVGFSFRMLSQAGMISAKLDHDKYVVVWTDWAVSSVAPWDECAFPGDMSMEFGESLRTLE